MMGNALKRKRGLEKTGQAADRYSDSRLAAACSKLCVIRQPSESDIKPNKLHHPHIT